MSKENVEIVRKWAYVKSQGTRHGASATSTAPELVAVFPPEARRGPVVCGVGDRRHVD